jgi:ABC-2 type transport system permease protein
MTGSALAIFEAALRAMRRATTWWSVSVAALIALTIAFWPAFRGGSGISDAIDSLPPAIIQAFGLQDFGTPAGFLRGNLYELFIPLLFGIAAVNLVNGQTASDEAAGRLELFLAQPVSRGHVFVARAVACAVALAVIVTVTGLAQVGADLVFGLEIDAALVMGTVGVCALLAVLYGSLAYLVACIWPRPSLVLGLAIAALLAGYVIAALFPIADALKPWRVISPWDWALGGDPLKNGVEPWRALALAIPSAVFVVIGTVLVGRRDVASA